MKIVVIPKAAKASVNMSFSFALSRSERLFLSLSLKRWVTFPILKTSNLYTVAATAIVMNNTSEVGDMCESDCFVSSSIGGSIALGFCRTTSSFCSIFSGSTISGSGVSSTISGSELLEAKSIGESVAIF